MAYYYITQDGSLVESTRQSLKSGDTRLNELQYAIAKVVCMGYSQREIEEAMAKVFEYMLPRKDWD